MKAKKNPKVDVGRNSDLYFTVGLLVMLFITHTMINYKTYATQDNLSELLVITDEIEEEIPITEQIKTPPPPPPPPAAAPEAITIVDDVEEIEETVIESSEITQEDGIEEREVFVEDVEVEEEEEYIEVPFSAIEDVPIFPGCTGDNDELRKCFQEKMAKHIKNTFKYPEDALDMGIHGKVYVLFKIDTKGNIANIRTRGPDKRLEAEAHRIVSSIPKMIPGKQRGIPVNVPYSLPITFHLEN